MIGGFWGRLVLSLVLLAVTFVIEFAVLRAYAKRNHQLHKMMAKYRARLDKALSVVAREKAQQDDGASAGRVSKPLSPEEKQAKKDWTRAHLMKHSNKPDWKRDAEYLNLVVASARGGCGQALNQLCKYAFVRRAYVEAYFWVLKMEMAEVRNTCQPAATILRHWLKNRTKKTHHRFHTGFQEEQYRFARAVMRIRGGVDREKGLQRLRLLVDAGYEDVRRFVKKNGLEEDVSKVELRLVDQDAVKTL